MSAMPRRQKLKKLPPAPPAPPPPPSTREDVKRMFLLHLASTVEHLDHVCAEWTRRLTAALGEPAKLASDLEWANPYFEAATKRAVYDYVYKALSAVDSKATIESVAEYSTKEALGKSRYLSMSSSPISNVTTALTKAAWAGFAEDMISWVNAVKRADEYYKPALDVPESMQERINTALATVPPLMTEEEAAIMRDYLKTMRGES